MTYSNFADSPASALAASSSIDGRIAVATSQHVHNRAKKGAEAHVTEIVDGGAGMAPGREEIQARSPVVGASVGGRVGEAKRRGSAFLSSVKEYVKPGSPTVG